MPADYVGLVAESTLRLPAGSYILETRSDDGIRVLLIGKVMIEDWTHHGATPHDVELGFASKQEHTQRVEWFELNGGAELIVSLEVRGAGWCFLRRLWSCDAFCGLDQSVLRRARVCARTKGTPALRAVKISLKDRFFMARPACIAGVLTTSPNLSDPCGRQKLWWQRSSSSWSFRVRLFLA